MNQTHTSLNGDLLTQTRNSNKTLVEKQCEEQALEKSRCKLLTLEWV
jgi:hypothetical protein